MSDLIKRQDVIGARVRALEIMQAKIGQNVWLTRFTLGALLTIALAGGAGMVQLNREVVNVKTLVLTIKGVDADVVEINSEVGTGAGWFDSAGSGSAAVLRGGQAPCTCEPYFAAGARRSLAGGLAEGRLDGGSCAARGAD